jgi:hypothetical protein
VTDDRLERDIRQFLAARDPGPGPASLHAAVSAVPNTAPVSGIRGFLGRALPPLAAAAVLVVLVTVLASLRLVSFDGAGATPVIGPTPSSLPSLVAGDGVMATVNPSLLHLALAGTALIGLGVVAARAKRRVLGYGAITAILGIVWIGSMIGTSDALEQGGGAYGVEPFLERPAGFESGVFVRAEGDVEFRLLVGITNFSRLPLDLVGIAPGAAQVPDADRLPRIVGVGYLPDDDCCLPSGARAFTRLHLDPGQSVQLVVLARAGRCATTTVESGASQIDSLPLVYEQLTLLHTAAVQLEEPVSILNDGTC